MGLIKLTIFLLFNLDKFIFKLIINLFIKDMSDHEDYGGEDEAFGDDIDFDENELGGEDDVDIVDDEDEDQLTGAFG